MDGTTPFDEVLSSIAQSAAASANRSLPEDSDETIFNGVNLHARHSWQRPVEGLPPDHMAVDESSGSLQAEGTVNGGDGGSLRQRVRRGSVNESSKRQFLIAMLPDALAHVRDAQTQS